MKYNTIYDLEKTLDIRQEPNFYLLTWNPKVYAFEDYEKAVYYDWNTRSKRMEPQDKFFLIKLGCGKKSGIVGFGEILSFPTLVENTQYIDIKFEFLAKDRTPVIMLEDLKQRYPYQCWTPQSSGISIDRNVALEIYERLIKCKS